VSPRAGEKVNKISFRHIDFRHEPSGGYRAGKKRDEAPTRGQDGGRQGRGAGSALPPAPSQGEEKQGGSWRAARQEVRPEDENKRYAPLNIYNTPQ